MFCVQFPSCWPWSGVFIFLEKLVPKIMVWIWETPFSHYDSRSEDFMQNLLGVRWCVDGDVGIYSSLNASEHQACLAGLGLGGNYVWWHVIVVILFVGLEVPKRWDVGGSFYSHHMWVASHKVRGNSYGGS